MTTESSAAFALPAVIEEYVDAYIEAAGLRDQQKGPILRSALGKTKQVRTRRTTRHRRLRDGIRPESVYGGLSGRRAGITAPPLHRARTLAKPGI